MKPIKRTFDFSRYKQRHIALKILYFGWDYDGLAAQIDSQNTVEFHLFEALKKTCLIESRDKCGYNRCGRTDKGVSSYGQVVNLCLRSNLLDESKIENLGLFTPPEYSGSTESNDENRKEIAYVDVLNRVLPKYIKALAWSPVRRDFSSRFSCQSRSYSYLFPKGDLSIESMKESLSYIVGQHDFRNLCSFDLKHGVTNHTRTILSASIVCTNPNQIDHKEDYSFYEVIIVGQAFLYHQIRCVMTVLFLVGCGKEKPTVFRDLLDISKCPGRPNYNKASPVPLSLFSCDYSSTDIPCGWQYDEKALQNLVRQLKNLWLEYKTKSNMIERVLFDLERKCDTTECDEVPSQAKKLKAEHTASWKDFGLNCDNMSDSKYVPLMLRPRDETLDEKLENLRARKL